jgi:hypothetical protein
VLATMAIASRNWVVASGTVGVELALVGGQCSVL